MTLDGSPSSQDGVAGTSFTILLEIAKKQEKKRNNGFKTLDIRLWRTIISENGDNLKKYKSIRSSGTISSNLIIYAIGLTGVTGGVEKYLNKRLKFFQV